MGFSLALVLDKEREYRNLFVLSGKIRPLPLEPLPFRTQSHMNNSITLQNITSWLPELISAIHIKIGPISWSNLHGNFKGLFITLPRTPAHWWMVPNVFYSCSLQLSATLCSYPQLSAKHCNYPQLSAISRSTAAHAWELRRAADQNEVVVPLNKHWCRL